MQPSGTLVRIFRYEGCLFKHSWPLILSPSAHKVFQLEFHTGCHGVLRILLPVKSLERVATMFWQILWGKIVCFITRPIRHFGEVVNITTGTFVCADRDETKWQRTVRISGSYWCRRTRHHIFDSWPIAGGEVCSNTNGDSTLSGQNCEIFWW